MKKLLLRILPQKMAICRMEKNSQIPSWAKKSSFFSISKTDDELSIVCEEKNVPAEIKSEKNWRGLKVEGPLDFSLTGILASLANPLAAAKISIFAISTFDTDYVLMKNEKLGAAVKILRSFCDVSESEEF